MLFFSFRAETIVSGTLIRPVDDGSQSSTVTIITQMRLRGSAPQFIKNGFLADNPVEQMQMLKKFYIKHQGEVYIEIILTIAIVLRKLKYYCDNIVILLRHFIAIF